MFINNLPTNITTSIKLFTDNCVLYQLFTHRQKRQVQQNVFVTYKQDNFNIAEYSWLFITVKFRK